MIAFIGGSTANLYGARLAYQNCKEVVVFERKTSLRNDQIRKLPRELLERCGYPNETYVRLTDLKEHLAKHLDVVFSAECKVENGMLIVNGKAFPTEAIIMNTGQRELEIEGVYTYSYATDKQYAGASLEEAFDKVEKIIEGLE